MTCLRSAAPDATSHSTFMRISLWEILVAAFSDFPTSDVLLPDFTLSVVVVVVSL